MESSLQRLRGHRAVSALTLALAIAAILEAIASERAGSRLVVAAVLAGVTALVLLRPRLGLASPLAALVVIGVAAIPESIWVQESAFVFLLVLLLCGLAGSLVVRRAERASLVVLWAVGSLAVSQQADAGLGRLLFVLLFMSIAWVAGLLVGRPIARARTAEARAELLEREQAQAAREAVMEERERIARELHDVIAHSVSVMTVQAGAVRRMLTPTQQRERESLLAVEQSGREALAEMRRLVGLLKADGATPSYAPQPGLGTLETLIDTVRDAGLPVELAVEGSPRTLPPGVDLAAFRVVQEGLTNALKHAGPARASVSVRWSERGIQLEVEDDGSATGGESGGGNGIAGMRERVELYGGRLESGARPAGGYLVRAFLPTGGDA